MWNCGRGVISDAITQRHRSGSKLSQKLMSRRDAGNRYLVGLNGSGASVLYLVSPLLEVGGLRLNLHDLAALLSPEAWS